jgi:putative membrane protein
LIWIHVDERHDLPALGKDDLLAKITCLNLIPTYAIALKHRLRFEPYTHYDDLRDRVGHLTLHAKAADELESARNLSSWPKTILLYLGVPMANSNPRKQLKYAHGSLGKFDPK